MARFDLFVILAEMRTGSNFLEANLNAVPGLACHGEAFNPHFIGDPDRRDILGETLAARQADPGRLLALMREAPGLNGFRFFGDHDPRVLAAVLPDPRVAKVVLTRNPAETYVSRQIAVATDQWRLTNPGHARVAQARFESGGFEAHLDRLREAQAHVQRGLQVTGQTAFWIDYEDIQDLDVLNGVIAWLGAEGRLGRLNRRLKKQNPEPMAEKVSNFGEMEAALARLDRWELNRTPVLEPRRPVAVGLAVAAGRTPLLFMPLRSGPDGAVRDWLARLDGDEAGDGAGVVEGFTPKSLQQWKAARPGHLSFTVLRHPLARAHAAFCERILGRGAASYPEIRRYMRQTFALPVPEDGVSDEGMAADDPTGAGMDGAEWGDAAHRAGFGRFLAILRANLGRQTSIRVDAAWASQLSLLQGIAGFVPPDAILREDRLAEGLTGLAARLGRDAPPLSVITDRYVARLARVADARLETLARAACARDYQAFGFDDWRPAA